MRLTGGLLLVLVSAVSLAGCIHSTGPCYGVGCHAFTTASASQTAPADQPDSQSGKKPHRTRKLLKKIKL